MKRIAILSSLLAVCFGIAVQAQTAPKPAPEFQQLHGVLGNWTYTCDYQAGPLGPAGSSAGECNNQMILGAFFMKGQWKEKGRGAELEGIDILRYDPEHKNSVYSGYENDGGTYSGTITITGTVEKDEGKFFIGGREYQARTAITYSADWTSADWKAEVSSDGKTWSPWFEQKMTKVKPKTKTK